MCWCSIFIVVASSPNPSTFRVAKIIQFLVASKSAFIFCIIGADEEIARAGKKKAERMIHSAFALYM
jgi:hypothetical protein